jgi:hypothetical protein
MKNLLLVLGFLFITQLSHSQSIMINDMQSNEESEWKVGGGKAHILSMNYTLLGKSYARGLWYGSAGYATGMWLSGNRKGWGIVGSILAVNIPMLIDSEDRNEVLIGKNLGALSANFVLSFTIDLVREGKLNYNVPEKFRKR